MSAAALLVFARCAGFAFRAPGFSHPSVPRPVRAVLALVLAVVLTPGVALAQKLDGASLVAAAAMELAIGAAIGVAASLLYDAAYAAGRLIDDYVGVRAIAPSVDLVAPSGFGRLWSNIFTAAFFLLGTYRPMLLSFAASFHRMPLASALAPADALHQAQTYAVGVLSTALGIAAPAVALIFLVQVALGALSRAVPRFGSVTLAFPLVFAAAIVATLFAAPVFR